MGEIFPDITKTTGSTPLVRLNWISRGLHADILVKLEFKNPLGSVKDRIGPVSYTHLTLPTILLV